MYRAVARGSQGTAAPLRKIAAPAESIEPQKEEKLNPLYSLLLSEIIWNTLFCSKLFGDLSSSTTT